MIISLTNHLCCNCSKAITVDEEISLNAELFKFILLQRRAKVLGFLSVLSTEVHVFTFGVVCLFSQLSLSSYISITPRKTQISAFYRDHVNLLCSKTV